MLLLSLFSCDSLPLDLPLLLFPPHPLKPRTRRVERVRQRRTTEEETETDESHKIYIERG